MHQPGPDNLFADQALLAILRGELFALVVLRKRGAVNKGSEVFAARSD
jgi:hypothetical protein